MFFCFVLWCFVVGAETKSRKKVMSDLRITAYHEAGHALVGLLTPGESQFSVV